MNAGNWFQQCLCLRGSWHPQCASRAACFRHGEGPRGPCLALIHFLPVSPENCGQKLPARASSGSHCFRPTTLAGIRSPPCLSVRGRSAVTRRLAGGEGRGMLRPHCSSSFGMLSCLASGRGCGEVRERGSGPVPQPAPWAPWPSGFLQNGSALRSRLQGKGQEDWMWLGRGQEVWFLGPGVVVAPSLAPLDLLYGGRLLWAWGLGM